MSLYEQKLQISQVAVSTFHVEGEAKDIGIEKAGNFMSVLAIDYSTDKINRRDLYIVRDQRLEAQGLKRQRKKKEAVREIVLCDVSPWADEIINAKNKEQC